MFSLLILNQGSNGILHRKGQLLMRKRLETQGQNLINGSLFEYRLIITRFIEKLDSNLILNPKNHFINLFFTNEFFFTLSYL